MTTVDETIEVAAPADRVYALVADLPAMGRWSPECVRCDWVGGATGAEPGARFKGRNRIGWRRWSTNGQVVAASPGRELAFDITVFGLPVSRWTYRFEPLGPDRTRVTETWEDRRGGLIKVLGGATTGVGDRESHNREGMRQTLQRIKEEAEGAPARP